MTHTLTVAVLFSVLVTGLTLLVAYEPGTVRRFRRGLAYHRSGRARHARREAGDESADEPTTPMPALTPARTV